jgi:hypothetical protein
MPVVCTASAVCAPGDTLGVMTLADCCVKNSRGLAYSPQGSEQCVACVGEF